MRLIIEVETNQELEQAKSLLASLPLQSAEIRESRTPARQNFVKRYRDRENQIAIRNLPAREERNAR